MFVVDYRVRWDRGTRPRVERSIYYSRILVGNSVSSRRNDLPVLSRKSMTLTWCRR